MGYFQITSVIYRIANNLICQASNVVVISHLKQFIGCSLTIIHEGHACFMNNQSNSNTSRLDNEKLLRGIRPTQVQKWKEKVPFALYYLERGIVVIMKVHVCLHVFVCLHSCLMIWIKVHFLKAIQCTLAFLTFVSYFSQDSFPYTVGGEGRRHNWLYHWFLNGNNTQSKQLCEAVLLHSDALSLRTVQFLLMWML